MVSLSPDPLPLTPLPGTLLKTHDRIAVRATWGHLKEGEEEIVAKRLREVLTGSGRPSMDDVIYHPAFYLR